MIAGNHVEFLFLLLPLKLITSTTEETRPACADGSVMCPRQARDSDKRLLALWISASGEQLDLGRVGIPRGELQRLSLRLIRPLAEQRAQSSEK